MAVPPVFTAGQILTAAQMNAIGMWVVKPETTFTAATSFLAEDVFTSDFTNYRVNINYRTSGTNNIGIQLRVSGTNATTNYNAQLIQGTITTPTVFQTLARADFPGVLGTNGAFDSYATIDISKPNIAAATNFQLLASRNSGAYTGTFTIHYIGNHTTATAYTGLSFAVGGGENATGTYTIYGYTK